LSLRVFLKRSNAQALMVLLSAERPGVSVAIETLPEVVEHRA